MHAVVNSLVRSLRQREILGHRDDDMESGAVGKLARVYEIARNALEYRADHLVRRAAIERVLRRQMILTQDSSEIVGELMKELKWAGYVKSDSGSRLEEIVNKYMAYGKLDRDWLVGVMSAEIEETFGSDFAYQLFTNFAFQVLRNRIEISDTDNPDLVLFVAIDRVYAESDEARVGYHLYKLIFADVKENALIEAERYYRKIASDKLVEKVAVIVRKQMGPLVLLRDMFFAKPDEFVKWVEDEKVFRSNTEKILIAQLQLTRERMSRATVRSVLYVFLTKMIFGIGLEVPVDRIISGRVQTVALAINLLVPVILMWIVVSTIRLPSRNELRRLVDRTVQIVFKFDESPTTMEMARVVRRERSGWWGIVFMIFYTLLTICVFSGLSFGLLLLGLSVINVTVFIFFLSIIMFFAYRIKRTADIYSYSPGRRDGMGWWDVLILPTVWLGGLLSQGMARLNFFVMIFDFVLEAPFKMILGFFENWGRFLSTKRDEIVG